MSSRVTTSGQQGLQPGSHTAPYYGTQRGSYSYRGAGVPPPAPVSRSHGTRGDTDHALISRNFFTQFLIDVAAVLAIIILWLATGFSVFFAIFCMLFVQF